MFRVTTEVHFAYGHRLMDYDGKCAHPHGHNGRVEVELAADVLDEADIAVDFTLVKRRVQDWVDQNLDHKMVLRRDDPLVPLLAGLQEPVYLMEHNPTAERLAELIFDRAAELGLPVARVRFWESPGSHATFEPAVQGIGLDGAMATPAKASGR
jgi:6-pyruvoyltetrahydropterin/6-carboxytetrahydropterin synthase